MNAIRLFAAALVAVSGLVFSAPDANAHGRDGRPAKQKKVKWKKHARYERQQPQYRVVYKWVWSSHDRNWEWKAVYEPVRYEYDDRGHNHPFPEHDGHRHGNDGSCRF